jgi:P27 family predicted phage terminase small subunit
MVRPPGPPAHLKAAGSALFERVIEEFDLNAAETELLAAACVALDRLTEARELLDRDGLVVESRAGPRAHPAFQIERDSRVAFDRILARLHLTGVVADQPPTKGSHRSVGGLRRSA